MFSVRFVRASDPAVTVLAVTVLAESGFSTSASANALAHQFLKLDHVLAAFVVDENDDLVAPSSSTSLDHV